MLPPVLEPSAALAACAWLNLWATLRNRTRSRFFCSWTATRFLELIKLNTYNKYFSFFSLIKVSKLTKQCQRIMQEVYLQSLNSKCNPTFKSDLLFSTAFVMAISTLFPKNCACWLLALISDNTCWTLAAYTIKDLRIFNHAPSCVFL